jgi:hypothetical protein
MDPRFIVDPPHDDVAAIEPRADRQAQAHLDLARGLHADGEPLLDVLRREVLEDLATQRQRRMRDAQVGLRPGIV